MASGRILVTLHGRHLSGKRNHIRRFRTEHLPEQYVCLNARRYIAVFSFIVAEEYRGTKLNYDMLMSIMPELKTKFDFIFIPVMHRLKTHQYWQRWGAKEFYRDENCVYYKLDI